MSETSALPSNEPLPSIPSKSVPSETMPLETLLPPGTSHAGAVTEDLWKRLRLPHYQRDRPPVANANTVYKSGLSPLDKLAVAITDKVGSMGFFLTVFSPPQAPMLQRGVRRACRSPAI